MRKWQASVDRGRSGMLAQHRLDTGGAQPCSHFRSVGPVFGLMLFGALELVQRKCDPMNRGICGAVAISALTLSAAVAEAQSSATGLRDAIANGTTSLRVRYRLEHVDQASFDEQALASTALGRWTWNSDQDNPWTVGLEGDYVFVAGIEDFNSTTNGKSQFPIVADPEGGDLNQAFLKYTGDGLTVTAGRQRINLGTQRFVGGVAFRQNEQTYDALRVQMSRGDAMLDYSYVNNINRIFGPGDSLQPGTGTAIPTSCADPCRRRRTRKSLPSRTCST